MTHQKAGDIIAFADAPKRTSERAPKAERIGTSVKTGTRKRIRKRLQREALVLRLRLVRGNAFEKHRMQREP